ncbi:MAG TPA: 3-phosphoshikimate 1-carboxyvinyltransferase [Oscillospiraceae bacterium]|nr:3-phosphoshikimate 1-carboxyvinyltransferase [Oscillospiraceae bacterium]
MNIRIRPCVLTGEVEAVSSKSFLHRQMIGAMLSEAPVTIACRGISEDVRASAACAKALGSDISLSERAVRVTPCDRAAEGAPVLNCAESGSTARFFLPVAAALRDGFSMTGAGRLPERPMAGLCRAMETRGCAFSGDRLPLSVRGRLTAGEFRLPGDVSSQYVTGLLLALPLLSGDSRIHLTTPLSSKAYVEMTLAVLRRFGVRAEKSGDGFFVPGNQTYRASARMAAEGDWSNAAFWLCADGIGKNRVSVAGLDPESVQGDRAVLSCIETLQGEGDAEIRVGETPDLLPALAVLACARRGVTVFTGAARLRLKESDRLAACEDLIRGLGGEARASEDALAVAGTGRLRGGTVSGHNDHRIVMAAAVASLLCQGDVIIMGAGAADKSYPDFFEDFRKLGGIADVL